MRHAILRRGATAVKAKAASALLNDTAGSHGTWYGCVGVWVCVWWWDELFDGFKNQVYNFFD